MAVIYPDENYNYGFQPQKADDLAYGLENEKKAVAEATEEIKKDLLARWKKRYADAEIFPPKLAGTNPEVVEFMLSFKHTLFYNKLAGNLGLDRNQRDNLPQIVWEIVIGKNWRDAEQIIAGGLGLDGKKAGTIADFLFANILDQAKILSEKPFVPRRRIAAEEKTETKLIAVRFSQSLKQYPSLGEQLITSGPLRLRVFPAPVRPSIKNWIADYHENAGAGSHGVIDRGNYLFHTENTRRLTDGERQRVGYIIKALDEDAVVTINQEKGEIVFQANEFRKRTVNEPNRPPAKMETVNNESGAGNQKRESAVREPITEENLKFSSPHTFPAEKRSEKAVFQPRTESRPVPRPAPSFQPFARTIQSSRPNLYRITPINQPGPETSPRGNNSKNDPKTKGNVVDLRN